METRLSRWLGGVLEAGWLAAIITVPLFFNIHSDRVFEPDKIALLRSIALVMVAAWLVRFVDGREWRNLNRLRPSNAESFWHRPFVLAVLILAVVYLVSTLFSVTPQVSFAGSYQRLQGTYTTLTYITIFLLMAATIDRREQVRRVVTVAIVTSIPIAFYGLLQRFGLDPLPWGGDVSNRVAGHMGNAIFIAAYLIMVVPLTLSRVIDAFSDILSSEKLAASDVVRSSIYIFTLAIQLITIYWSGSRGPLIGLAVGLFSFTLVLLVSLRDVARQSESGASNRTPGLIPAALLLLPSLLALLLSKPISDSTSPLIAFAVFMGTVAISVLGIFLMVAAGRGWRWLWLGWIALTIFIGGWLLLFNVPAERTASLRGVPVAGAVLDTLDEWRDLPTIGSYGRMLDPSNTEGREKSGRVRVLIWEGVVDLISPHDPLIYPDATTDPFNAIRTLIGYGPESMYVAYNSFYPPELATIEARNASPDRSHNETFDALVITGVLGFLSWQALYLSVVLFAFRYLGVVRSRRDFWVFVGLVVGSAALGALAAWLAGTIYLGVAVPTGVVAGIVIYLIYYALFSRPADKQASDEPSGSPFQVDRLLMNALVAAVLAHYVEIHFGIAIGATRLYFFVYVALMVALAYALPRLQAATDAVEAVQATGRKRKRDAEIDPAPRQGLSSLVLVALLIMLMIGTIGYSFVTYALPPDKVITSSADLTTLEIFQQAFLQNAQRGFVDSPFILGMIVLTWVLGWLVFLSEMAKHGELAWQLDGGARLPDNRRLLAAGGFAAMAAVAVLARFLLIDGSSASGVLGQSLALAWAFPSVLVAYLLLTDHSAARSVGGAMALGGLLFSPVIVISGGLLYGLGLAALCASLLAVLWSPAWRKTMLPVSLLALLSLAGGLGFTLLHTQRYRTSLFFQPDATVTSFAELRALEASQAGGLLTGYYLFVFLLIALMATAIAWPTWQGVRRGGRPWVSSWLTWPVLIAAFAAAIVLIGQTNLRIIQADMVFKRGRPFDDQASRLAQTNPEASRESWDATIAIYDQALSLAPAEDFYYLFLGRGLLERSALTQDRTERIQLLQEAENRLLEAQAINPLNTDHTANLARLNTRWAATVGDTDEMDQRVRLADSFYDRALALSPNNSVIRNERARLALELIGDCDQALALYDESVEIDPLYILSWLARADAYVACGNPLPEPDRTTYYETAAGSLLTALDQRPDNVRAWVQLAEVYREIAAHDRALAAIQEARSRNSGEAFPPADIDFIEARIEAARGNIDQARALAERALATASPQTAAGLEDLLLQLQGGGDE